MAKESKVIEYEVVVPFEDSPENIKDGQLNVYAKGDDVGHFETERIARLIERGIIKKNSKD